MSCAQTVLLLDACIQGSRRLRRSQSLQLKGRFLSLEHNLWSLLLQEGIYNCGVEKLKKKNLYIGICFNRKILNTSHVICNVLYIITKYI